MNCTESENVSPRAGIDWWTQPASDAYVLTRFVGVICFPDGSKHVTGGYDTREEAEARVAKVIEERTVEHG